jgi:hypothetical protein
MLLKKLTELPLEVVVWIISYLPTIDIVKNVSLVCKQLNLLSKDSDVGISVSLTSDSTPEKVIQIFEQRSSQIKHLMITNISEETQKVLTNQIGSLKCLQKFEIIHSSNQTYKFPKKCFIQLFQLKHLKELDLLGDLFEESSLNTLEDCQQLRRLILNFPGRDYVVSKEEFKSIIKFRGIKYFLMHFEMNFGADFLDFPVVPLHIDKQRLLNHCYFLRFLIFSPSHLRMIAAQMPNLCSLAFICETFEIDLPEFLSALKYLFQRCKSLAFIFCMDCKISDFEKFKETFSGWNFWKYNYQEGKLGMFKSGFYPKEAVLSITF